MADADRAISGRTPEQWQQRLEEAAADPNRLAAVVTELDQEMRGERTWLHDNPTPGKLFLAVIRFFKGGQRDLDQLGQQIDDELFAERNLQRLYRSWLPGETYLDRLFPYLKGFGGEVTPDATGLQFPGFERFKGIKRGDDNEIFAFYINTRFPGRDPANFHLTFHPESGELIIARAYRMELPRRVGEAPVGRAIIADLMGQIVDRPEQLRLLVVDNAANVPTRETLMRATARSKEEVVYEALPAADPLKTPLGHLLHHLALENGYAADPIEVIVQHYGVLKLSMRVRPA